MRALGESASRAEPSSCARRSTFCARDVSSAISRGISLRCRATFTSARGCLPKLATRYAPKREARPRRVRALSRYRMAPLVVAGRDAVREGRWSVELAWDGHRVLAVRAGDRIRIVSVDFREWSDAFPGVALATCGRRRAASSDRSSCHEADLVADAVTDDRCLSSRLQDARKLGDGTSFVGVRQDDAARDRSNVASGKGAIRRLLACIEPFWRHVEISPGSISMPTTSHPSASSSVMSSPLPQPTSRTRSPAKHRPRESAGRSRSAARSAPRSRIRSAFIWPHGVLGPRHRWRGRIVPRPPVRAELQPEGAHLRDHPGARRAARASAPRAVRRREAAFVLRAAVLTSSLAESGRRRARGRQHPFIAHWERLGGGELYAPLSRVDWATLLKRTFAIDIRVCCAAEDPSLCAPSSPSLTAIAARLDALRRAVDRSPTTRGASSIRAGLHSAGTSGFAPSIKSCFHTGNGRWIMPQSITVSRTPSLGWCVAHAGACATTILDEPTGSKSGTNHGWRHRHQPPIGREYSGSFKDPNHGCNVTLINPYAVLTSAWCVDGVRRRSSSFTCSPPRKHHFSQGDRRAIHPDWKRPPQGADFNPTDYDHRPCGADDRPEPSTPFIKPAEIATAPVSIGQSVRLVGWAPRRRPRTRCGGTIPSSPTTKSAARLRSNSPSMGRV